MNLQMKCIVKQLTSLAIKCMIKATNKGYKSYLNPFFVSVKFVFHYHNILTALFRTNGTNCIDSVTSAEIYNSSNNKNHNSKFKIIHISKINCSSLHMSAIKTHFVDFHICTDIHGLSN